MSKAPEKPAPESFKDLDAEVFQRRRRILLESARRVLQRDGIREATLRRIAQEADVTTGAIYHYFKNQDHVFAAVYADAIDDTLEKLENLRRYNLALSHEARVRLLVHAYVEHLLTNAWSVDVVVHNVFGEAFDGEAKRILEESSLKLATGFTQLVLPDHVESEDLAARAMKSAEVLWSLLNGLVGMYRLSPASEREAIGGHVRELAEHAVTRLFSAEEFSPEAGIPIAIAPAAASVSPTETEQ